MERDKIIRNIIELEYAIGLINGIIRSVDKDINKSNLHTQIELIQDKIDYLYYLKDNNTVFGYNVKISPTSDCGNLCLVLHKKGSTKRVRLTNITGDCINTLKFIIDSNEIYSLLYNKNWSKYMNVTLDDGIEYILDRIIKII